MYEGLARDGAGYEGLAGDVAGLADNKDKVQTLTVNLTTGKVYQLY